MSVISKVVTILSMSTPRQFGSSHKWMFGTVMESFVMGNCFWDELEDSGSALELDDSGPSIMIGSPASGSIFSLDDCGMTNRELLVIMIPANAEDDESGRREGFVGSLLLDSAFVAELLDSMFDDEVLEFMDPVFPLELILELL